MSHSANDTAVGAGGPVDISHLLYTNFPPNEAEKTMAQGEVDMLAPSIQKVRAQLRELEDRMFRCRSIASPI
ncbi:hypothetical protein NMY22_g18086 [Coprinellus aureogranulatus]|nr:hypothetical protein NMY22_g18086 [Coprinellus aureogranulatus]